MKNSIKYLFWLLFTPLLCIGVSFGLSYDLFDNLNSNLILNTSLNQSNINISLHAWNYYCYYVEDSSYSPRNQINLNIQTDPWYWNCSFAQVSLLARTNFCFMASCDNQYFAINPQSYSSATIKVYEFDEPIVLGGGGCSVWESCYSDSDINSLTSQLSSCSSSLSTCNSDLSSCTNSCDTLVSQCQQDKASLQSSYSGCLETNDSLSNYNSSLLDQLEACYISWSTTTGDFVIYEYQLSRNDWYSDLYLPITNSIKLPYGYRGFLDDGVLAIKQLNSLDFQYSIEDSDFQDSVIWSYSVVYLFLISSGLFLVFLYIVRRYFIWLKSVK